MRTKGCREEGEVGFSLVWRQALVSLGEADQLAKPEQRSDKVNGTYIKAFGEGNGVTRVNNALSIPVSVQEESGSAHPGGGDSNQVCNGYDSLA